jgi:hypothetical protein
MSNQVIERKPNGQFAKGVSGNLGGNAQRTRHIFNKAFLEALAADFRKGGPEAIAKVRKQQPAAYMKICALLVPKEMRVGHTGGVKSMSDDELERAIEAIQAMLAARDAGASARVIEATAEQSPGNPETSTPPAVKPKPCSPGASRRDRVRR